MKAILICALFSLTLCMGSWTKESLYSNDLMIDRSRQAAEKHYYELTGLSKQEARVYPFAVYSQLVNGVNYKILFAVKNKNTGEISFHDYTVFTGTFADRKAKKMKFDVTGTLQMKPDNANVPINSLKFAGINDAISLYYKNINEKLGYVNTISSTTANGRDAPYGKVYLAKLQTQQKHGPQFAVLMEENGKFEVCTTIFE